MIKRNISKENRSRMGGKTKFKPTHGLRNSPEYYTWVAMLQRCYNPNVESYPHYGGRGICVCQSWNKFENFLADMGFRPSSNNSLDRIDNNGNYEPNNCRWIDKNQQQCNTSKSRFVIYFGQKMTVSQLCRLVDKNYSSVLKRLHRGHNVYDALNYKPRIKK